MKRYLSKALSFGISLSYVCLAVFILHVVSGSFIAAQDARQKNASKTMSEEQEVLQIENEIFEAIKNKDTKKIENLLAEDFVYRTHDGKESDRTVFLETIKSFPLKILSVKGENLNVEIFGDVAVLTGVQRAKVKTGDGKTAEGLGAFTDVFVRRNKRWMLKSAFNVELPSSVEPQKENE